MNHVTMLGRFTADPDLRFLAGSGMACANFNLAVDKGMSREKKEQIQAQGKPTADFPRCKAFGKTAELIANHFSKGNQIIVEGSINTGRYTKEDGTTVYTTDVLVNRIHFVGGNSGQSENRDDFSMGGMDTSDFQAVEDEDDNIPF